MTTYAFTVKGTYPNGNKATLRGYVQHADPDFPVAAFDAAVAACVAITPDLIVTSKPGRVVLRRLVAKDKRASRFGAPVNRAPHVTPAAPSPQ